MRYSLQISLTGGGHPLRVTKETARALFFDVFHFSLQEKFELEMPQELWPPCGKGLIDHLHRRCTHEELSALEVSWLERGLNALLQRRNYRLLQEEGVIEKVHHTSRRQGFYLRWCGALFLLSPMPKEWIARDGPQLLVREDRERGAHLLRYRRVKTSQGRIWVEMSDFFDASQDRSMTLLEFQDQTRQLYRVVGVTPQEVWRYSRIYQQPTLIQVRLCGATFSS